MEELIGQATISGLLVGALVWVFRSFVPKLMQREDKARADERTIWREELAAEREAVHALAEAVAGCPARTPELLERDKKEA